MQRFVKRPIEVEAWQVGSSELAPQWLSDAIMTADVRAVDNRTDCFDILTLEGVMRAFPGSWIIRGAKGELYPCRVDIFAETYLPVDGSAAGDAAAVCEAIRLAIIRTGWSRTAELAGLDRCNLHRAFGGRTRGSLPNFTTITTVAQALGLRLLAVERPANG